MSTNFCTEYMEDKINDPHKGKPFAFIESAVKYRLPSSSVLDTALLGMVEASELKLPDDTVVLEIEHTNGKFIIFAMNTTENKIAYEVRAKYANSEVDRWQRLGIVGEIDNQLQLLISSADGYSECSEDDIQLGAGFGRIILAFIAMLDHVDVVVTDDLASVEENERRARQGLVRLFDYKDVAMRAA